eukprot:734-Heterococcus_DN1.PRE.1
MHLTASAMTTTSGSARCTVCCSGTSLPNIAMASLRCTPVYLRVSCTAHCTPLLCGSAAKAAGTAAAARALKLCRSP